jgi:hypothetical protein
MSARICNASTSRLWKEDHKFKATLGYVVRPVSKTNYIISIYYQNLIGKMLNSYLLTTSTCKYTYTPECYSKLLKCSLRRALGQTGSSDLGARATLF